MPDEEPDDCAAGMHAWDWSSGEPRGNHAMSDLVFTRPEDRGGVCPDCGEHMPPGTVNEHMAAHVREQQWQREIAMQHSREHRH